VARGDSSRRGGGARDRRWRDDGGAIYFVDPMRLQTTMHYFMRGFFLWLRRDSTISLSYLGAEAVDAGGVWRQVHCSQLDDGGGPPLRCTSDCENRSPSSLAPSSSSSRLRLLQRRQINATTGIFLVSRVLLVASQNLRNYGRFL
jgi:hypothetical protein